jgi:hypothetical protein
MASRLPGTAKFVDEFYNTILSYNLFTDILKDNSPKAPPLKSEYKDFSDYTRVIEPWFWTEFKQTLNSSYKHAQNESILVTFEGTKNQNLLRFHPSRDTDLVTNSQGRMSFFEHRLFILTPVEPLKKSGNETPQTPHVLSVVSEYVDKILDLRVYLPESSRKKKPKIPPFGGKDILNRAKKLKFHVTNKTTEWHLRPLESCVTALRQFLALRMIDKIAPELVFPFLNTGGRAKLELPVPEDLPKVIPKGLRNSLENLYNFSQKRAVGSACKPSGVTLIQGPPGTGKTTTIVGVLSLILASNSLTSSEESGAGLGDMETTLETSGEDEDVLSSSEISEPETDENWLTPLTAPLLTTPWLDLAPGRPFPLPWYDTVGPLSLEGRPWTELNHLDNVG